MSSACPRIAILGIHLESNAFAFVTTGDEFRAWCYFEGEAMLEEAAKPAPAMPAEIPGFVHAVNASGAWRPVPIVITAVEPGGPADQAFIEEVLARMRSLLAQCGPLDAAYVSGHGAMVSTTDSDPDGALDALARDAVGPDRPVVQVNLTSLEQAIGRALEAGQAHERAAICLADVACNPRGGARGSTTEILERLIAADVRRVLLGNVVDPAAAARRPAAGVGAGIHVVLSEGRADAHAREIPVDLDVLALSDGVVVGRRGSNARRTMHLGPSAAVRIGERGDADLFTARAVRGSGALRSAGTECRRLCLAGGRIPRALSRRLRRSRRGRPDFAHVRALPLEIVTAPGLAP